MPKNIADLLGGDEHLHQEVLDAPARKRRIRCVIGGLQAHHILPRVPREEGEGEELVDDHFRAQELANSEKQGPKKKKKSQQHHATNAGGSLGDARRA